MSLEERLAEDSLQTSFVCLSLESLNWNGKSLKIKAKLLMQDIHIQCPLVKNKAFWQSLEADVILQAKSLTSSRYLMTYGFSTLKLYYGMKFLALVLCLNLDSLILVLLLALIQLFSEELTEAFVQLSFLHLNQILIIQERQLKQSRLLNIKRISWI